MSKRLYAFCEMSNEVLVEHFHEQLVDRRMVDLELFRVLKEHFSGHGKELHWVGQRIPP